METNKLTTTSILLHWVVGLTVTALLGVGLYMEKNEVYSLYPIHKSIGILVVVFVLWRVINRLKNGWPKPLGNPGGWQPRLARLSHWILILGTILMPVSGMMMSGAGGYGLDVFGLELLPRNMNPANPQEILAHSKSLAKLGAEMHEIVGYTMIGAVLFHVCGAFKHHLIDKDGTLRRMFGANVN